MIRANTTQWKVGLAALYPRCSSMAKEAMRRRAQEAFDDSQARVHVVTGRLKESGRMEEREENGDFAIDIIYGGVEFGVDYAGYEESYHPFLEPSAVDSMQAFGPDGEKLEGPFD